jgi:hypothetical protein
LRGRREGEKERRGRRERGSEEEDGKKVGREVVSRRMERKEGKRQ